MADADKTNILIVDDLPEKLLVYETVLEELGQNVITARSGAEALKAVLRHDFAVILLDVNMPDMDGFETAALIRRRKRSAHTPIIFVTAFADDVRAAQGYAQGAVDYILAPVVPEVLRAKVQVFVDLFRMTEQIRRQAEDRVALAEERIKRAAAEDSNRRLGFLARACNVLGQSLDAGVTARDLARLPVPFLADLSAVALPGRPGEGGKLILARAQARSAGDGTQAPSASAGTSSHDEAASPEELTGCGHLPEPLAAAVERVLAGGPAEFFPEPPSASPEPATTALVLPLCARGQPCAALALSREPSGRRFGPAELSMAETLASRAAVALENAHLYQDVQQADRQKNEFLSMLAHELRNPLAPIRNAVHVMRLQGPGAPELQWARDVIDRQVKHMVRLVDDLLDISRITRGKIRLKLEPVDMAAVVAEAVEASRPVIEARRHGLEVSVAAEPLRVNGDAARLAQVLTNLLNNAAKYTDEGGRIWLTVVPEDGAVVARVRDTGVGIPAEALASVFNLFTQMDRSLDRSQGGLGIGLTLVRRLVEMHGGSVEARSEGPGRGSEFVVRLPPFREEPVPADAGGADSAQAGSPGCRVLVVDDNVDAADSLAMLLRLGGCEVRLAHSGADAVEAAPVFRPQLVILDIGLPGMDGYEVARRLRADPVTRGAALVAVTGYGREEDRALSREAGFDHHLVKPVDFGLIRGVLASLAAGPPRPAGEPGRNGQRSATP
jgi:signal transduction histidine kinase/DNA-binding response OmpR family regulator